MVIAVIVNVMILWRAMQVQQKSIQSLLQSTEERSLAEEARRLAEDAQRRANEEILVARGIRDECVRLFRQVEECYRFTETTSQVAEKARQQAEEHWHAAEQARNKAEHALVDIKTQRELAEQSTRVVEQAQVEVGNALADAKMQRDLAEQAVRSGEQTQRQVEDLYQAIRQMRQTAEDVLRQVQADRLLAERARDEAVHAQSDAAQVKSEVNQARDAAVAARAATASAQSAVEQTSREVHEETTQAKAELGEMRNEIVALLTQTKPTQDTTISGNNETNAPPEETTQISKNSDDNVVQSSDSTQPDVVQLPQASSLESGNTVRQVEPRGTAEIIEPSPGAIPPTRRSPTPIENRPPERTETGIESPSIEPSKPRSRAEILCVQRGRQWFLLFEPPEEIDTDISRVIQDGTVLERDQVRENCYLLVRPFGTIAIEAPQQNRTIDLANTGGDFALFKLIGKRGECEGRRVRSVSVGAYLIVVPSTWQLEGDVRREAEPIAIKGWQAYYALFERTADTPIRFRTTRGIQTVKASQARFEFVGERINDASEYMGPLFGSKLPTVRASNLTDWSQVSMIVVGEEGRGQGTWRSAFKPAPDGTDLTLTPEQFANRHGGWYFVRFYDCDDTLIESVDFRFASGLKNITNGNTCVFPGDEGHLPANIEFHHESGWSITPADKQYEMQTFDFGTRVVLPRDYASDSTEWSIIPPSHDSLQSINVAWLTERIWWAVADEKSDPTEWIDKPITLSRADFFETSTKALWLRLPCPRWTDTVFVGFSGENLKSYDVKVDRHVLAVPLRDWSGSPCLGQIGNVALVVRVNHEGQLFTKELGQISIRLRCKHSGCEFATAIPQELIAHIAPNHLTHWFRTLSYSEMVQRMPSLPPQIYLCPYCGGYIRSDDLRNPTSTIYEHIERRKCSKVPRFPEPPVVQFRVVRDTDEIREHVIRNLPHLYECGKCSAVLENPTEQDQIQHLIKEHRDLLFHIV